MEERPNFDPTGWGGVPNDSELIPLPHMRGISQPPARLTSDTASGLYPMNYADDVQLQLNNAVSFGCPLVDPVKPEVFSPPRRVATFEKLGKPLGSAPVGVGQGTIVGVGQGTIVATHPERPSFERTTTDPAPDSRKIQDSWLEPLSRNEIDRLRREHLKANPNEKLVELNVRLQNLIEAMQSGKSGETAAETPADPRKDGGGDEQDDVSLTLKAEIGRMVDEFVDADTVAEESQLGEERDYADRPVAETKDGESDSDNGGDSDSGKARGKTSPKSESPTVGTEPPPPAPLQKKSATPAQQKSTERKRAELLKTLLKEGRNDLKLLQFDDTLSKEKQKQALIEVVERWRLKPKQVRKPSVLKVLKERLRELSKEMKQIAKK